MKSLSVSKYYNNNSLLTPDKRLSRQTTQSTQKKDALSVQSYFSEQSQLKSEASKKEIIRLIKSTVDSIDKNIGMRELNIILTKLLAGLSSCINEQDMSLILIQLIQSIKQIIQNNQTNEKQVYDQERAQLLIRLQQLEQQSKENQLKFENKLKEYEIQHRVLQYQDELNQMKKNQGNKDSLNDRNKLKDQIKEMQQKMLTLSEKERKLIQLVKAVKSRGIDVEKIYKNLNVYSSKNSKRTSKQSNSEVEDISFTESNLADMSQLDYSVGNIKRHAKFVID
ncbi:unnamed protein product [Paramecium octaurelia]|uniref:Uncharacterized protein n=1 Tax=Paramecium octaurelia TaxID=43137 RepID=A0A8S1YBA1_PAROT|nr:unnamed protein product [Paramecium octaurelia]